MRAGLIKVPNINFINNWPYYIVFYVFLMMFLQMFRVPHVIVFILDFVMIAAGIALIRHRLWKYGTGNKLFHFQILFFLIGIVTSIISGTKPILILWSFRNYGRFIIYIVLLTAVLRRKEVNDVINLFKQLYILNFIILFFQLVILRIDGDSLGGIFGTIDGVNGYANIYLIAMSTLFIWEWIYHKLSVRKLMIYLFLAVAEASLAEIKVYYIELVLIMLIAFFKIYFIDKKKGNMFNFVGIIIIVVFALVLGVWVIGLMRPEFVNFMSIEKLTYILTNDRGYSADGKSVNRLNAISMINAQIFTDVKQRIFGLGMGAAEFSQSSELLTSNFYRTYSYLKYKNFLLPWMYIENGYVGLTIYILSFVYTVINGLKRLKQYTSDEAKIFGWIGVVMTIISIILIVYSSSMRIDSAYIIYFFIVLNYINLEDGSYASN